MVYQISCAAQVHLFYPNPAEWRWPCLVSQTNAAVDFLFGFTGRPEDEATGLQNNMNRWYDAKTGIWLSNDPTGFSAGDTNLARYCGNSPTNHVDPSGLTAESGSVPVPPYFGGHYFPAIGGPYDLFTQFSGQQFPMKR